MKSFSTVRNILVSQQYNEGCCQGNREIDIEHIPLVTVLKDGDVVAEFDQGQSNGILSSMMNAKFTTSEDVPTYSHNIILHNRGYSEQIGILYNEKTSTIIIGEEVIWASELLEYFDKPAPKMIGKRCYKYALLEVNEPIMHDENTID